MILLEKYVKFLVKNNITERQFLILLFIYYKRQDLIGLYKQQFTNNKNIVTEEDKEDLRQKGFLYKDEFNNYFLTNDFIQLFVDKDIATDEIFEIYPVSMQHQGVTIPLKAMDRSVFAVLYITAIMGSVEEHKEVIEDIHYAKTHNLLNIGIEKFIKSKYWLGIRKQRLENKKQIQTKTAIDKEF